MELRILEVERELDKIFFDWEEELKEKIELEKDYKVIVFHEFAANFDFPNGRKSFQVVFRLLKFFGGFPHQPVDQCSNKILLIFSLKSCRRKSVHSFYISYWRKIEIMHG